MPKSMELEIEIEELCNKTTAKKSKIWKQIKEKKSENKNQNSSNKSFQSKNKKNV